MVNTSGEVYISIFFNNLLIYCTFVLIVFQLNSIILYRTIIAGMITSFTMLYWT